MLLYEIAILHNCNLGNFILNSIQKCARYNINYVYEPEAKGKGLFFDYRIGYPDFYLPDYDVYVEYWGLVDADDEWTRERYIKRMKKKMAQYYRNNIKFISIYPDNLKNLDWIFRRKFQKVTGFELATRRKEKNHNGK